MFLKVEYKFVYSSHKNCVYKFELETVLWNRFYVININNECTNLYSVLLIIFAYHFLLRQSLSGHHEKLDVVISSCLRACGLSPSWENTLWWFSPSLLGGFPSWDQYPMTMPLRAGVSRFPSDSVLIIINSKFSSSIINFNQHSIVHDTMVLKKFWLIDHSAQYV